jgi:hypothetical protein
MKPIKKGRKQTGKGKLRQLLLVLGWHCSEVTKNKNKKQGDFFGFFFFYVLFFSTLLHLPLLRLHCVGGGWDRTQDCCDLGIASQTL